MSRFFSARQMLLFAFLPRLHVHCLEGGCCGASIVSYWQCAYSIYRFSSVLCLLMVCVRLVWFSKGKVARYLSVSRGTLLYRPVGCGWDKLSIVVCLLSLLYTPQRDQA